MDSRICSTPFTRMAYPVKERAWRPLKLLRGVAATATAIGAGVVHTVTHRSESLVELKAGDPAPDFTLPGSDGRTYRLKDLAGRPVVLAWFPKAFTGG
jgi:thioredoxin-dependent peroxiredoxin